MAGLVMLLEQVLAEVAGHLAPDGMNMICVILRVIQLDQERRRLNPVIVRGAPASSPRPCEVDISSRLINLGYSLFSEFVGHVAGIFLDQRHEGIELPDIHRGSRQAGWLALKSRLAAGTGQDFRIGDRGYDGDLLLAFVQSM